MSQSLSRCGTGSPGRDTDLCPDAYISEGHTQHHCNLIPQAVGQSNTDPVLYLIPVDIVKSIQQHLHHFLDLGQCELHVCIAEEACQVVLTEIKHQVDAALAAIVWGGYERSGVWWIRKSINPNSSHSHTIRTLASLGSNTIQLRT